MTNDIIRVFERAGAYLHGHFLLTSGRHSDVYFEKFILLQHPDIVSDLCGRLAAPFKGKGITAVVGPTLGGIVIAYELARQLDCRAVYAEPGDNARVLRRGFELARGERVLLCDDILTTGRSLREVITLAESYAAEILGLVVLLDRSGGRVKFDYPLEALAEVEASAYEPAECPLCAQGLPMTQRGSRQSMT
jgi:orotate phosphoribosyltransferase